MKSAYFVEKNKMEVREFPKAQLVKETDAIIKIVRACVCGSDLWWFRGISERQPGPVGHEAICHCSLYARLWTLSNLFGWL